MRAGVRGDDKPLIKYLCGVIGKEVDEGGRQAGMKGRMEAGMEGGREGRRDAGMEGGREGRRETGMEGGVYL